MTPKPRTPYIDSQAIWNRRQWVSPEELAELSRLPTAKTALQILLTWLGLLTTFGVALWAGSLIVDLLAWAVNGVLLVMLSYWNHEATHFLLSRDRRRNDLIADLFLAGPVGMTVAQHRWQHARHHAHLNDPEQEIDHTTWICVGGPRLAAEAFLHLIGWYALVTIFRYQPDQGARQKKADIPARSVASMVSFVVVNGALFALCALAGQWHMYFVLWVAPLFTVSLALMNIVNIVEHQSSSEICDAGIVRMPPITRVVRMGLLERYLIAPVGVAFHFEHHRFPGVPAGRLPELHRLLEERGRFREPDIVRADGFLRTIWRLSRDPAYGTRLEATDEAFQRGEPHAAG